jgi:hypothetical protein
MIDIILIPIKIKMQRNNDYKGEYMLMGGINNQRDSD